MSDDDEGMDSAGSGLDSRLRGGGKRGHGKHSKGAAVRAVPAGGRGLEKKVGKQKDDLPRGSKGKDPRASVEAHGQPRNSNRRDEERDKARPMHNGLKKVDVNIIGSKSRVCIPAAALALMRGTPQSGDEEIDMEGSRDEERNAVNERDDAMVEDGDGVAGMSAGTSGGARSPRAATADPDARTSQEEAMHNPNTDITRRTYGAMLHRILEEADVLLEVLDARDPLSCRTWHVEHFVNTRRPDLKIVLVLNKIDLVPKDVVSKWVKYLQAHHQVVVFKAATSYSHRGNAALQSHTAVNDASGGQLHSGESFGAPELVQALKGIGKGQLGFGGKAKITVGVVGYPNVGKSSLINSLLRTKAAQTGDRAGVTKHTQTMRLDKGITIIDCPGVVLDDQVDEKRQLLTNCLPADKARDVISPIAEVVERCGKELLKTFYNVGDFTDHVQLLSAIAQRRGKLLRGGEPDQEAAARSVLQDWNRGKLKYYTLPPEEDKFASVIESTVVDQLGTAFKLFPASSPPENTVSGATAAPTTAEEEEAGAGGVEHEQGGERMSAHDDERDAAGMPDTDESGL